jgi:hypothetical protein
VMEEDPELYKAAEFLLGTSTAHSSVNIKKKKLSLRSLLSLILKNQMSLSKFV